MTATTFMRWRPERQRRATGYEVVGPLPEAVLFLHGLVNARGQGPFTNTMLRDVAQAHHEPQDPVADTCIIRRVDAPEGVLVGFSDRSALVLQRARAQLRLPAACIVGTVPPQDWTSRITTDAFHAPWTAMPRPSTLDSFRTGDPVCLESLFDDPGRTIGTPHLEARAHALHLAMLRLWDGIPLPIQGLVFERSMDGSVSTYPMGLPPAPIASSAARRNDGSDPKGHLFAACKVAHCLFPGRLSVRRRFAHNGTSWSVEAKPFASSLRQHVERVGKGHGRMAAASALRAQWPDAADLMAALAS